MPPSPTDPGDKAKSKYVTVIELVTIKPLTVTLNCLVSGSVANRSSKLAVLLYPNPFTLFEFDGILLKLLISVVVFPFITVVVGSLKNTYSSGGLTWLV